MSRPGQGTPIPVPGQVDTGADVSVIPEDMARSLSLSVTGYALIRGAVGLSERRSLYRAAIALEKRESVIVPVLTWNRAYALVGRDLLNRWRTVLDGPGEVAEISV